MTKVAYKRKRLIWGSPFQRVRVHGPRGEEHGSRQVGMMLEQRAGTDKHKVEREKRVRASGKWHGLLKPPPVTHLAYGHTS